MQSINVGIRAFIIAMLVRLQALILPLDNAKAAYVLRTEAAIATGKRLQRLHKVLKSAQKALDPLMEALERATDGLELRHLRAAVNRQCDTCQALKLAILVAEEDFQHGLELIEEAKARFAEANTETMQQHIRGIMACHEILRRLN
jgi:hypothetical protein